MEFIKDGWFSEKPVMWPGQKMSLQVEEVLFAGKSDYQDVLVFRSTTYGVVLVLDGVIQITERDEFSYQEMIAHLPLYSHPAPRRVLVVGGGDGGAVREVLRHPEVEEVTLCEIDAKVVEVSKQFLPSIAASLSDPRVTVRIQDGFDFLRDHPSHFDVVITDSSDPVGPAEVLFEPPYFKAVHGALRAGGLACSQGECIWLDVALVARLVFTCRAVFGDARYAFTTIPTYPCGQIGFVLAAKAGGDGGGGGTRLGEPARRPAPAEQKRLRYYNPEVHRAAFVLPEFARAAVEEFVPPPVGE